MSFERLIRLSQKTGRTLIVHDPIQGRDVVLVPIDDYEELLSQSEREKELHDAVRESFFSSTPRWKEQVLVPDVPVPPPMPQVIDPEVDLPPLPEFGEGEEGELGDEEGDIGTLFDEPTEAPEPVVSPIPEPVQSASGWHSLGGVARERFQSGAWIRGERERLAEEAISGQKVGRKQADAEEDDGEDPVFYEEPVG